MVAERVITMPRFLFLLCCCRILNFSLLCPTSTCNSSSITNNNKTNNKNTQPWHKKWLVKKCQTREKMYTKNEEWNKRETDGKCEPFSIFSHTMECFAYPSVLSPGAANIFIARFICCGVRGIKTAATKKKRKKSSLHSKSKIFAAMVCFRSFVVKCGTTFSNGNQIECR